jgi:hypothetical protein
MNEPTAVEFRLDRLEQDNRRLKQTVGALLLVLAAVPLVGAVMPQQIPDVIEARTFRVIDENGNYRVSMFPNGIAYYSENRTARAVMSDLGILLRDNYGTMRAWIKEDGIWYFDENGNTRAQMGSVLTYHPTAGVETRSPAQVVLFDAEGNVTWKATR